MQNAKRKIIQQSREITNNETGEIIKDDKYTVQSIPPEEDYVKIYLKDILYLNDLPNGLHPLMMSLLKRINYSNEVVLVAYVKRQIAEETKFKMPTIDKYLGKLVNAKILMRKGNGVYVFNPYLFGRGKWQDIQKMRDENQTLRLFLEYDNKGRKIHAGISEVEYLFDGAVIVDGIQYERQSS
jgi:hypothetical protein